MKIKKYIILLIGVLSLFICLEKVDAAGCSSKELSALKKEARLLEFSYEFNDNYNDHHIYPMYVSVDNMNEKFYIIDSNKEEFTFYKSPKISLGTYKNGESITYKIYASKKTNCYTKLLYSKNYDLPHYNDYSTLSECKENKDFPLCNRWYEGKITSEEEFREELKKYQEEKNKKETNEEQEEKQNILVSIINYYKNHLLVMISLTLILVGLISYFVYVYIIKRRKERIKIKLSGE